MHSNAYPEYKKIVVDETGPIHVTDRGIHMWVGASATLRWKSASCAARRIGTVEEPFLSRLQPGDRFLFAGRTLELVRIDEMVGYVRRVPASGASVPRWMGGHMLSSELSAAVRELVDEAAQGCFAEPEMAALQPLFELQRRWSAGFLRKTNCRSKPSQTREGHHLFVFPFGGRLVHHAVRDPARVARRPPASVDLQPGGERLWLRAVDRRAGAMASAAPIRSRRQGWPTISRKA